MKPVKIFLTFLSILALIAFISYVYPPQGIRIVPGFTLDFPTWEEIIEYEEGEYKDISGIVQNNMPVDSIAPLINDSVSQEGKKDSLPVSRDSTDTTSAGRPQSKKRISHPDRPNDLQYPDNNPAVLYPFFKSLRNLTYNNELIRILHYGDSQIEGDRISSYLRNQLQKKFGGAGIGLFPLVLPENTHISLKHSISKGWRRYTLHNLDKANFKHRRFGVLMSFSRFSPYYSNYQDEVYEGWITLRSSPIAFDLTSEYTRCRIFFGFNDSPYIVKMKYGDKTADAEMIPATSQLKEIKWEIPKSVDNLTLGFQGNHSPDIYGIALDGKQGIALDNIPLRGSSGISFTKTDTAFYKKMLDKLNVKLIITHFGVNLVPVIREDYDFYEEKFYKQLKMLKSLDKDLSVIVMGVTDMSRKKGGQYETYPNIPKIRDAQRRAAFRANCAFWDTYEAMGGKNSMPSWVFADPPLARKDFTHFTYKGSVVIAKMFYKALMREYQIYKQRFNKEQILSSKEDSS
jgi:hypothetical protein